MNWKCADWICQLREISQRNKMDGKVVPQCVLDKTFLLLHAKQSKYEKGLKFK